MTSPKKYIYFLNQSWRWSLKFFVTTMILIGLLRSAALIAIDVPVLLSQLDQASHELAAAYPSDLVIHWDQNQLSISPENYLPIKVPYFEPWKEDALSDFVSVINPSLPNDGGELTKEFEVSTLTVVTSDQLWLNISPGLWNTLPLRDLPKFDQSFEMTSENKSEFLEAWSKYLQTSITDFKWFVFLFFPMGLLISRLMVSLVNTFLAYLLLQIWGKDLKFSKVWQLVLHLLIPTEIIGQISEYAYADLEWSIYSLSFWLLFSVMMWYLKDVRAVKLPDNSPIK